jgi:alpha-L-fucosidase
VWSDRLYLEVPARSDLLVGPKLNLAKLHADAIREKGLKVFMSLHTEWNFGGYWAYGTPTTTDPSLQKLYGQLPNATEQTLWLNELKEVIDEFLPDILYQDRYLSGISQTNLMTFLAYYYNAALANAAHDDGANAESLHESGYVGFLAVPSRGHGPRRDDLIPCHSATTKKGVCPK